MGERERRGIFLSGYFMLPELVVLFLAVYWLFSFPSPHSAQSSWTSCQESQWLDFQHLLFLAGLTWPLLAFNITLSQDSLYSWLSATSFSSPDLGEAQSSIPVLFLLHHFLLILKVLSEAFAFLLNLPERIFCLLEGSPEWAPNSCVWS